MKRLILYAAMMLFASTYAFAQSTPTVILTVSTNGTISPVTPTLTWSSNGVTTCTASSSPIDAKWSGTVAVSGSLAVGPITVSTTYTITCSSVADNQATFSWTAPTLNTDGTVLTNLAGYKLYQGSNGVGTLVATITSASATTYQLTNLAVGSYSWYLTAYNSSSIESSPSNNATKSIVAAGTATDSKLVSVSKKPAAPQAVTVR